MSRLFTVMEWDLMLGLRNRFMQVFAFAGIVGGVTLLAASPGPETLPLIMIQAILFFGSLFAFLIGWGSGQQARDQGAFLAAQPIGNAELVAGKVIGTGLWGIVLMILFLAPAVFQAGLAESILPLVGLPIGFLLVCMLGGMGIGLLAAPVTGLLAVLLAWGMIVAGWELGLLVLSQASWIESAAWLFVVLLLINPAGSYRIGAMIDLESVPFDTQGVETGRWVFEHISLVAMAVFAAWTVLLFVIITRRLDRQEY